MWLDHRWFGTLGETTDPEAGAAANDKGAGGSSSDDYPQAIGNHKAVTSSSGGNHDDEEAVSDISDGSRRRRRQQQQDENSEQDPAIELTVTKSTEHYEATRRKTLIWMALCMSFAVLLLGVTVAVLTRNRKTREISSIVVVKNDSSHKQQPSLVGNNTTVDADTPTTRVVTTIPSISPTVDDLVMLSPSPMIEPITDMVSSIAFPKTPTEVPVSAKMPIPTNIAVLATPTQAPVANVPTPTAAPTKAPSRLPIKVSRKKSSSPTVSRSVAPTAGPTAAILPTNAPLMSARPTILPTKAPVTSAPSSSPTVGPSVAPTAGPTAAILPTRTPLMSARPTILPTKAPVTSAPSKVPSMAPHTKKPTKSPITSSPTGAPSTNSPTVLGLKSSWPELLGTDANKATWTIVADRPDITLVVVVPVAELDTSAPIVRTRVRIVVRDPIDKTIVKTPVVG